MRLPKGQQVEWGGGGGESTKLWVTPKLRAWEKFKSQKRKVRRIKEIRTRRQYYHRSQRVKREWGKSLLTTQLNS